MSLLLRHVEKDRGKEARTQGRDADLEMTGKGEKMDRQPGRPAGLGHGGELGEVRRLRRTIGFGGQLADDLLRRQASARLILRIDGKDAVVDGLAGGVAHYFVQRHPLRHMAKERA